VIVGAYKTRLLAETRVIKGARSNHMQAEPGMILVCEQICRGLTQRIRIRRGENLVFSDRKPTRPHRTIALTGTHHENSRFGHHLASGFEQIVRSPEICVEHIPE